MKANSLSIENERYSEYVHCIKVFNRQQMTKTKLEDSSLCSVAGLQTPVVQRVDNFIHCIGRYVANKRVQEFPYSPKMCV